MRRSHDRKVKQEESQLSPNKEFLLRFLSYNFERRALDRHSIASFNFYIDRQIDRILKDIPTIVAECEACIMLFSSLISNLEEISKDLNVFSALTDTFYFMIEFLDKTLQAATLKTLKEEEWNLVIRVLQLFDILEKHPKEMPEPNRDETSDKKLLVMSWIDEIPQISKMERTVLSEEQAFLNIHHLYLNYGEEVYKQMVRSGMALYLESHIEPFMAILLSTVELALINRKQGVLEKALKLYLGLCKGDILDIFDMVRSGESKGTLLSSYKQLLEFIPLEKYLNYQQIFRTAMDILSSIQETALSHTLIDICALVDKLVEYSLFFSEVSSFSKVSFNIYEAIVRVILISKEKVAHFDSADESPSEGGFTLEALCNNLYTLFRGINCNTLLRENMKLPSQELPLILLLVQNQNTLCVQQFVLKTLPELVDYLPVFPTKGRDFLLAVHLRLIISFINKNRDADFSEYFVKHYPIERERPLSNFEFAVYFCFLFVSDTKTDKTSQMVERIIQNCITRLKSPRLKQLKVDLFSDLVLLLNLIKKKDHPILRCSVTEFTDRLFNRIELMSQSLSLPSIVTNETFLFNPHESMIEIPDSILTLTTLLNNNQEVLTQDHSQIFYYVLIEMQNLLESNGKEIQVKSPEIEMIKRIRSSNNSSLLSFGCMSLQKSVTVGNNIEIFHALIRIYSIVQNEVEDLHLVEDLEKKLLELLFKIHSSNPPSGEEVQEIYNMRMRKKEGYMDVFNKFIQYSKDMHVVKFYSEAKDSSQHLHLYVMEIILRIMLKISSPERVPTLLSPELQRIHLIYLPRQSPYLPKSLAESQLQLVYLCMYLVSKEFPPLAEDSPMKEYLLKEVNQLIQFYSPAYDNITSIIKFKEIDFIQYLLSNFLLEFSPSQDGPVKENLFVPSILTALANNEEVLSLIVEKAKKSNFVQEKTPLLLSRIKCLMRHPSNSHESSKRIYTFLSRLNRDQALFILNPHMQTICGLDQLNNAQASVFLCKELTLLKGLFVPTEDLVCTLFEYVGKIYEYYAGFVEDQELHIAIPQMICAIFQIDSPSDSDLSVSTLAELEKSDKSGMCSRLAGSKQSPNFRCVDCDEKRVVCHNCVVSCHSGHTCYWVSSNNRSLCQCSAPGTSNNCKFKKSLNSIPCAKKSMYKEFHREIPREILEMGRPIREIPLEIREAREAKEEQQIRDTLQLGQNYRESTFGRSRNFYESINPLTFFSSYGDQLEDHPFNRRQLDRYDRPANLDRPPNYGRPSNRQQMRDFGESYIIDDHMPNVFEEEYTNIFKPMGQHKKAKKTETQAVQEKRPEKQEKMEAEVVQEQSLSDEYHDKMRSDVKMEEEQSNIIRSQSYLLHIFLGIAEDRLQKHNRKASIHEGEIWKLPNSLPTPATLSDQSCKVFASNYKLKLNIDSAVRSSPMIARKPIAVAGNLVLLLSSLSIHVFDCKKFFTHVLNPSSQNDQLFRHDLLIEAHSVEFIPNNPRLLCVAGVRMIQMLAVNADNTITKHPSNAYENSNGEIINKIQCLEIGVLVGDAKSIKLIDLTSKNVIITIQGPKEGGIIREWSAVKEPHSKAGVSAYSLLVITSYGSIFQLQFDENDRGDKAMTKKLQNYNKKKDEVGVSMFQCNLYNGRKLMMAGIKDSLSNLAATLQNNSMEGSTTLKFNNLFNNSCLLGNMELVESNKERILLACTLKEPPNKEMSIHSGFLALVSMTKNQKFEVQHLQYHTEMLKCEGFFVWRLNDEIKLILSLAEDGSFYVHVVGQLHKDSLIKMTEQLENKTSTKEPLYNLDETRNAIRSKLFDVSFLRKVELSPLIDFKDKSEPLKRGTDYTCEEGFSSTLIRQSNLNKIITGISFSQSYKVVLPTRTVDNALEVGFSLLECLFYYAHGLRFNLEKPSMFIRKSEGFDRDETLAYSERAEFIPFDTKKETKEADFELYGQSALGPNSKLKKIESLVGALQSQDGSQTSVEIFKILQVFLKEIKTTCNCIVEETELKTVIDSFMRTLSQVNEDYYQDLRRVTILSLEVYNAMTGESGLRADHPLNPYTCCTEVVIKQIDNLNMAKTSLLVQNLYELASHQPQVLFFLVAKYHKLTQRIYKKYSAILTRDAEKEKEKPNAVVNIDDSVQKLLGVLIFCLNLKETASYRDDLLPLIKNIFSKYSGSKSIRDTFHSLLCKFHSSRPEEWITKEVKSVEEDLPVETMEPSLKEKWMGKFEQPYLSEDLLMQMDDEIRYKYALMIDMKEQAIINESLIEEEKMDFDEEGEMAHMAEEEVVQAVDSPNVMVSIFYYCMRPLENEDFYQGAYDHLLMAYTCFKAIESVQSPEIEKLLEYVSRFLKRTAIDRMPPAIFYAYLSLFSKVVTKSKHLDNNKSPASLEIHNTVLHLVDSYLQKTSKIIHNNTITFSHVLRLKPIQPEKISLPYSLLTLLRKPVQPTASILYLKAYSLLPHGKEFYKTERDRVIYQKSMATGDIQNVYRKAKKRPESWKKFANVEWLQNFIDKKEAGWPQALELLSLYYDS